MSQVPPNFNPYASPVYDPVKSSVISTVDMVKLVKQFRQQMHSLGALWIIIGILVALMGYAIEMHFREVREEGQNILEQHIMVGILVLAGVAWLGLGVITCLKQIWAVWVGLILSYLMALNSLLSLNICGLVIMGAAIFQAHRVIGWAKEMKRKGIPLATCPQDIQTPVNLPPQPFGPRMGP